MVCAAIATALTLSFDLNLALSAMLFWGVPAAILSLRIKPRTLLFAGLFSFLTTATVGVVIGQLSKANEVWFTGNFLFPQTVYGQVTIDDCIGCFCLSTQ